MPKPLPVYVHLDKRNKLKNLNKYHTYERMIYELKDCIYSCPFPQFKKILDGHTKRVNYSYILWNVVEYGQFSHNSALYLSSSVCGSLVSVRQGKCLCTVTK